MCARGVNHTLLHNSALYTYQTPPNSVSSYKKNTKHIFAYSRINLCVVCLRLTRLPFRLKKISGVPEVAVTYTKHAARACAGRNEIAMQTVVSRAECEGLCTARSYCLSYEYWGVHPNKGGRYCQVSSSCTYAHSSDAEDGADLYTKNQGMQTH